MPQLVKASVIQAAPVAYDLDATLVKLERLTRLAKERDGSQLAVFPEGFIGGYPKLASFGVVIGERSASGRDEFVKYHAAAIDIPSLAISRIESISRDTGIFLVVGVIERDLGTLYCTAIFVSPEHGYSGKHRKLMPTALERVIWGQGDGSTLPVVRHPFATSSIEDKGNIELAISATICWENYMPLLRTYYYSQGTQVYCAPTVDARKEWQSTMVHIALEGRCFVLAACQFARESDYPPDHPVYDVDNRDPDKIMIGGGSVIISPLGKVLAGPLLDGEGVLTAELDLDDIIRGKFDLDVIGHYARNDVFRLETPGIP